MKSNRVQDVNRWHSAEDQRLRDSGDTIREHQKRVAVLCGEINLARGKAVSWDLVSAAFVHDEAERLLGDMPYPAKKMFPALAKEYRRAEKKARKMLGVPKIRLADDDRRVLHLADRLDAYRWAAGLGCVKTGPWKEARRVLQKEAADLGLRIGKKPFCELEALSS